MANETAATIKPASATDIMMSSENPMNVYGTVGEEQVAKSSFNMSRGGSLGFGA